MICILCETGTETAGETISQAIQARFSLSAAPTLCEAKNGWIKSSEWDDLLLVVYQSKQLQPEALRFINEYRNAHALSDPETGERRPGGFIIPVATNAASVRPPGMISGIKAALYDGSKESEALVLRVVGTLLGMAVRPGAHQIFISYRSSDGSVIAKDLFQRLQTAGFHPWLDEANDNLLPGTDVQKAIMERVKSASMVVVVDTPDARGSGWMREEINTAIGQMILVFPVVTGPDKISRFISLRQLQRSVPVKPNGPDGTALLDAEWERVLQEIEIVLLSSYTRRLRVLARAEKAFTDNSFRWTAIDLAKRIFEARRLQVRMPDMIVVSHCSIDDPMYVPALRAYNDFLANFPDISQVNYKLCIYDRDTVLYDSEIKDINGALNPLSFILAHHNELDLLIRTNFGTLR